MSTEETARIVVVNDKTVLQRMGELPPVHDKGRVKRAFETLRERAAHEDPGDDASACAFLASDGAAKKLLTSVFGNSPFLTRQTLKYSKLVHECLTVPPEAVFDDILARIESGARQASDQDAVMQALRIGKNHGALLIAFCDIAGVWSLQRITQSLTVLADTCLGEGVRYLLRQAQTKGEFEPVDPADPAKGCGLAFIAMGKYGAYELNYSSDIDFTVFFDPQTPRVTRNSDPHTFAVRLTRELVKLLQESTQDGYVFRTDLRLRPDAGSTTVAVSLPAAEQYYESMGQNWERAAMIKARAAAGDLDLGQQFLAAMVPFVWRKYLDYAAIEDIHAIKRQIHSHRGHGKLVVPGHNIKLGYGGIREIEFFVQTQQLILGGRFDTLRTPRTLEGLEALRAEKMISQPTCDELKHSYEVLRTLEHRLQMLEDAQTHTLPDQTEALDNIAKFSGYKSRREFERFVLYHITQVHKHYTALFEKEEPLASDTGSLVFTGVEDDPETIKTLTGMGFARPEYVAETVRGWHFGRVRATRSERARELLTKLVPRLLESIAKTSEPDLTFVRFAEFLGGLPAGIQLFSLFYSHPELLDLVVSVLGTAPRLGPYMAKNAGVFDALLDEDFLVHVPKQKELRKDLADRLSELSAFEDCLNAARRFGKDEQFRTGIQLLQGIHTAATAGAAYSQLADIMIQALAPIALNDVIEQHGRIPGAEYAVLGMGKLGGREMTATSDIDLIIIYDYPGDDVKSDGPGAVDGPRYFTRFSQRLIAALSAQTAEGRLYEVDMQLRPSGKAGPVATRFASFENYYLGQAWTWELMALTRARVVAGTAGLGKKLESVIHDILVAPREEKKLVHDVRDMRDRLVREKGSSDIWDLKQVRGGLIDLEFIAQYLQLAHASKTPKILSQNTLEALRQAQRNRVLDGRLEKQLLKAGKLLNGLNQYTRLCFDGPLTPESAGQSLKSLLAYRTNTKSFERLERELESALGEVKQAFDLIIR